MKETIHIEGLDEGVPEEAREQINDQLHAMLRDFANLSADVVYWDELVEVED